MKVSIIKYITFQRAAAPGPALFWGLRDTLPFWRAAFQGAAAPSPLAKDFNTGPVMTVRLVCFVVRIFVLRRCVITEPVFKVDFGIFGVDDLEYRQETKRNT